MIGWEGGEGPTRGAWAFRFRGPRGSGEAEDRGGRQDGGPAEAQRGGRAALMRRTRLGAAAAGSPGHLPALIHMIYFSLAGCGP